MWKRKAYKEITTCILPIDIFQTGKIIKSLLAPRRVQSWTKNASYSWVHVRVQHQKQSQPCHSSARVVFISPAPVQYSSSTPCTPMFKLWTPRPGTTLEYSLFQNGVKPLNVSFLGTEKRASKKTLFMKANL